MNAIDTAVRNVIEGLLWAEPIGRPNQLQIAVGVLFLIMLPCEVGSPWWLVRERCRCRVAIITSIASRFARRAEPCSAIVFTEAEFYLGW
jgi:hypothetical protein